LFPALSTLPLRYLGFDASESMLAAHPAGARICLARLERLPLADGSVDWVLCNRLLHHMPAGAALEGALAELWRVARRGLCFSWFDAHSWPAWRQRLCVRDRDRAGRFYLPQSAIAAACARAGLPRPEFRSQSGWFSAQAFALLRRPPQVPR
jgi:ubiquinone/menaquinone biosynthesis C-methylase UbiE